MKPGVPNSESLTLLPCLHGRLEFAVEVYRRLRALNPDVIAVEFPSTIQDAVFRGVKRLPFLSVIHYEESDGTTVYLLCEPQDPLLEAVRFGLERDIPVHCVDLDVEGYPRVPEPMPDPYAVTRIGYEAYVEAYVSQAMDGASSPVDERREANMCYQVQGLLERHEKVAFVFGLSHCPGVLRRIGKPQAQPLGRVRIRKALVSALHAASSREVLTEMPFLAARYEEMRREDGLLDPRATDRLELHRDLVERAAQAYYMHDKEEVSPHARRVLFQFARNYAFVQSGLAPDFYQLIVAGKSAVNDNFGYEVWEKGSEYLFQEENPTLPVIRISGEDLYLNHKRIRFHRRMKSLRRRLLPVPERRKRRTLESDTWHKEWAGRYLCSYPPEDIAVEGFGDYVKKRAILVAAEENTRAVPFCASLMDGIAIRETVRNWATEQKIFVNEHRPMKGKVGSVVIVFDEDSESDRERFPWTLTWLGEHSQESDMAFYASPAGEHLVGPGVSQCVYGGFMLTYPPMRVLDIWEDPFFEACRTKPERLLMAALDYSLETHVVYVAAKPPPSRMRFLAHRIGKKILYLPIGMFSPQVLKKMRLFHVLDGHHVRKYAREYIDA